MRTEHDFLGELEVPDKALYGVQTMRARENFQITGQRLDRDFIAALAKVKKAAAIANMETGRLEQKIGQGIIAAANEVISGRWDAEFPVDPVQGGAGTSINMNMNEVLANRALDFLGEARGSYEIVSPNNHVNMAQSTNDAFPTAIKVCLCVKGKRMLDSLEQLEMLLRQKASEFHDVLKMGRTHLQDAVPITLGQEMAGYASAVSRCRKRIRQAMEGLHAVNMGATAVGTGLNAEPEYIKRVVVHLSAITHENFYTADNLVDATNNTDTFADMSAALKNTALVLIKMANDIRLMASGPRCGFNELKLPARQPGSSIMPGKVNPVMAEVLDQVCYQVIGNDLALSLAVENGQFELNVMEPVMAFNLFHSLNYLSNAVDAFCGKLLQDLQANRQQCQEWVNNSVGIVTALLPHIGYENSARMARKAYNTGRPIREIIMEEGLLTADRLQSILSPENMTRPGIAG